MTYLNIGYSLSIVIQNITNLHSIYVIVIIQILRYICNILYYSFTYIKY